MGVHLPQIISLILLTLLQSSPGSAPEKGPGGNDGHEELAVLPFEVQNLDPEAGIQLTQRFTNALARSGRFNVLEQDSASTRLKSAGLWDLRACDSIPCLVAIGKAIGVQRIVHVIASRRDETYILRIRVIKVSDGALLYAERVDHAGSYDAFVSEVIPAQAEKLAHAYLKGGARWYFVAVPAIVLIVIIVGIYRWLGAQSGSRRS